MCNIKTIIVIGAILFALSACQTTGLQTLAEGNKVPRHYGYPDIKYTVKKSGVFTNYVNSIVVPKNSNGAGVVLLSSCTGIQDWNRSDLSKFADDLLIKGYTVAMPDYNTAPRPNVRPWNCGRWKALQDMRLVKDIYDATAALSKVEGVDPNRIFTIGQSVGAQFGALAVGKMYIEFAEKNGWGPIPRAVIGLYGGCQFSGGLRVFLDAPSELNGIARPVLWMAGTDDRYYQDDGCSKETEEEVMKVLPDSKFILYKDATHCFDCSQQNGHYNKREQQYYYYNSYATKQSRIEIFNFMEKFK